MLYLTKLIINAKITINKLSNIDDLDNFRTKYLGKKGYLTLKMNILPKLPIEKRKKAGAAINEAKKQIIRALDNRKAEIEKLHLNERLKKEVIDVSLPGRRISRKGSLHPISHIINLIESYFNKLGFTIVVGLEIEDDYHNFDALNIPQYHPARDDQDTFWLDSTHLLRTQTSSTQIRIMKNSKPPIRIISPGRVYRSDYDQTHTPMFHQVEGLVVDYNINFSNLKGVLHNFLNSFFKENLQISFRPSYFPFTEPSAEVYIMNRKGKWLEVLGCGMVHPNVLHNVGINPEIYSGFAFGIGIERLAMLFYNISDLRTFFENDLRFLKQF